MDMNRIFTMFSRIFVRKAVNKGIDVATRRGKAPAEMSAAERKQAADARAMIKRARQAARITRRLGR